MIGLVLLVVGILSKAVLYDKIVGGLYSARYIDNTVTTSSCSTLLLGDVTCAGNRFQGWKMTSADKYDTCLLSSAPASKSLASAAKWCEDGKAGCSKPASCKPGSKFQYYFFSVLNADEVLRGETAEVKEMEPIGVRKLVDRVLIDEPQWNADGVAQWSELSSFELIDESQSALLDQVVVMPNPAAFVAIPARAGASTRMTSETLMYVGAAAKLYTKLQESITETMSTVGLLVDSIFSGPTAINWATLVKDAYRDGSPIVKLGAVFANNANCRMLMSMLTMAEILRGNSDFYSMMMCTDAYVDNIALAGFSRVLEMGRIRIAPEDGVLFFEYEKNCRIHNEKPSQLCKPEMVCPDASTRAACMQPSLSQQDVDVLFNMFARASADFEAALPELAAFLDTCTIEGHLVSKCDLVVEQLQKAGHAAFFSANPAGDDMAAAFGWTDKAVAATMIPYFVNGTVGQLMGYNGVRLPPMPGSTKSMGLGQWAPVTMDTVKPALFTRQQVSSKYEQRGLNYFKSAMGMDHSCAFSYRCMSQASFVADGKTCTVDESCVPNFASGYDVGMVPGTFFGDAKYGTNDFHGVGKTKSLFVSDMYVQANFSQVETDAAWDQILVDKWNVSHVGMRTENCDAADPMDRGIDCSSPGGTINIGYNAIYGESKTPNDAVLPLYSSFPHFVPVAPDTARVNTYDPLDKLIIHPCDSCPTDRDFMTFLWTDPQTGAHVRGSQKIQLNVRVSANPAAITQLPNNQDAVVSNGSTIVAPGTDVMIPMYWIDKYDVAAEYQRNQVAFVQSVPSVFTTVFWVGLCVGLVLLGLAGFLLWRGLALRRARLSRAELAKAAEIELGETETVDAATS